MKRGRYEIRCNTKLETLPDRVGLWATLQVAYWWWVYIAPNGEIVCTSEQLTSEAAARKGIASIKRGWFNRIVVAT